MAKYHAYSARTSDGHESIRGFSHKQMMKFLQDMNGLPSPWLLKPEFNPAGELTLVQRLEVTGKDESGKPIYGKPITATITHEFEELDFAHEAQARGLQAVRLDDKGNIRHTEDQPYVKCYGVGKKDGKLIVVEVAPEVPKTLEEQAAEASKEASELERRVAEAKNRAAEFIRKVNAEKSKAK